MKVEVIYQLIHKHFPTLAWRPESSAMSMEVNVSSSELVGFARDVAALTQVTCTEEQILVTDEEWRAQTRREIAVQILAGIVAGSGPQHEKIPRVAAARALDYADALLAMDIPREEHRDVPAC